MIKIISCLRKFLQKLHISDIIGVYYVFENHLE